MQPSYVAILRTPHARPLVLASLVGRLSSGAGPLALVLFVQDATGFDIRRGNALEELNRRSSPAFPRHPDLCPAI